MTNNRGYLILDMTTWLVLGGVIIAIIFTTTMGTADTLRWAAMRTGDMADLTVLDRSILYDLERGNNIVSTAQDNVSINNASYYNKEGGVMRKYEGTERKLADGRLTVSLGDDYLTIDVETNTETYKRYYRLFWKQVISRKEE